MILLEKKKIKQILIPCLVCFALQIAFSQNLGEMKWESVPTRIIPDLSYINKSILVVESTILKLGFESSKGILEVQEKGAGIWWIVLKPGVQLISISADGYIALSGQRIFFKPREAQKIKITAKQILGAIGSFDDNHAEIRLNYQSTSPNESIYGGLDDMVMKIDFSRGYALFNPTPGKHTIKLNAGGRIWEKSFLLKAKDKIIESVSFANAKLEELDIEDPGNLYINSVPAGAKVYLNKVEQGITPISIDDVQPGGYQVEVVHGLYLPESKFIEVKSNSYTKDNFKLKANFGKLSISSTPTGAMLWINEKSVGKTPFEVSKYSAGRYSIKLIKEMHYEVTDTIEIKSEGGYVNTFKLKPQFGGARISSDPVGAELSIDGKVVGKTPVIQEQLSSGKHIIHLTKENYFDYETAIEIIDGEDFHETFKLKANFGILSVVSEPSGANVIIAGENRLLGITPLKEVILPVGTYLIQVEKEFHESQEIPVSLLIGGEASLNPILNRKKGSLKVKSEPPEADVYLNGVLKGQTPTILNDLPTGNYEIRLEKIGFDIQLGRVIIEHKQQSEYIMTLGTKGTVEREKRRLRARMLSVIPSAGQIVSRQYIRAGLYLGVISGSAFLSYVSGKERDDQELIYNSEFNAYRNAGSQDIIDLHFNNAQSAFDKMNTANDQANLLMFVAVGVYAIQIADAWLYGGGKMPIANDLKYSFDIEINPYKLTSVNDSFMNIKLTYQLSTLWGIEK